MINAKQAAAHAWKVLLATLRIFGEIDAEQRAASFAYYATFALIPLLTLLLSVSSMFFDPALVKHAVLEFIPSGAPGQEKVWQMIDELQRVRGGVSIASLVILAWSSLKFFQALVRAVNRAWHTEEISWWQMPLKNLAMIGVTTSGFALGILLPAILQGVTKTLAAFEHFVTAHLPGLHLTPLFAVLDLSRYLVGGIVLLYTVTMLYTFAPRRRAPLRHVWMPAILVTISLQLSQIAMVNYLPRFINYNVIYGSIGGLMLLLFWIYLSGLIIIAGGCACAAHARPETTAAAG
ncbi:MAG: YihY/virulence factor BrkB family protein [Terrimicrobiaceae bacterium]|nr:YihY/virulence factor BrkB family protein [Terrimicrobiaceae bacterium]